MGKFIYNFYNLFIQAIISKIILIKYLSNISKVRTVEQQDVKN